MWNAIVTGSEDYHVKITLKKGGIEKSSCDCPHDAEYCKHIFAVLYAIKEEMDVLSDKTNIKSRSSKGTAKKPKDAIGEMVNKIPENDLRRFIVGHAETDREFRNMLVAHFSSNFIESGSHLYAKVIKNAARTAADRYGFIDYYNAAKAIQPVYPLLQKAVILLSNQ